ncbi:hypothetical protein [Streptomyces albipurpureus]|uniref:Uncharacterized protein n=1 Tax=Streptomyces albipurpureus TaxID=2897419 RepID=A0ABT0UJC1_9ACTN|nr:hypothetical protein [Streptomyces sp. CWNU-1]MCM2388190.1 hypothetical protein [Streptomyces sp. CWNU-1]
MSNPTCGTSCVVPTPLKATEVVVLIVIVIAAAALALAGFQSVGVIVLTAEASVLGVQLLRRLRSSRCTPGSAEA